MGLHVEKKGRRPGKVLVSRRPGERVRPQTGRPGGGASGSGAQSRTAAGATGGTRGDFGPDFE